MDAFEKCWASPFVEEPAKMVPFKAVAEYYFRAGMRAAAEIARRDAHESNDSAWNDACESIEEDILAEADK